jgi:LPXTG-motif cell wall-anchored protein
VPGLSLEVLEFADRLLLTNHTGKTITIYGYQGEPYARVLANGTAEQNTRSPATYLNTSFYGNVTVPASASPSAAPHWVVVDRTGQFEWHDHRIHWMSPLTPPQVKNKSKRTLVFNWQVPIRVGTQTGAVAGQLFWTPESSHASSAVIVLGVAIVLLGAAFVVFVRRRRSRAGMRPGSPGGGERAVVVTGPDVAVNAPQEPSQPDNEAW